MSTISDRLREVRKYKKMNQGEFADYIGFGRSTLGMMEVGKREILERHIKAISTVCGVDEHWLRTGEGDMFTHSDSFSLDEYAVTNDLTPTEIEIIKIYMGLPKKTRHAAIAILHRMFGHDPEETELRIEAESYLAELRAEKFTETASASQKPKNA